MKINLERVKRDIEELGKFNASPGNGVTRLAFSKEDKMARAYIREEMEKLGLQIWEDGYSNLFGRREGKNPDLGVIMIGSHFDTVKNGGLFDGVAGLVAALETLRVLEENNIANDHPIELVAMNDEEGVRFGAAVSNSRAMAGLISEEDLDKSRDEDGISLREAMVEFGIKPDLEDAKRKKESLKAFIELHIEQGPVLEDEKKDLGLVEAIVGLDRYKVKITGKAGHAGTTPMDGRKDALILASKLILAIEEMAKDIGGGTVATVGELKTHPNAANVIPGYVEFTVDARSIDVKDTEELFRKLKDEADTIGKSSGLEVEVTKELHIPPVAMSEKIIDLMEEKVKELGHSYMRMNSGAGHDAMIMAGLTSSGLIFVPSKDGLSHHPDEWTDYEDLEKGIELMLGLVGEISMKS